MTTNNELDALFADAEIPFGHPGRRFDDTPEGFDPSPLVDQEPEPDYTPDEDGGVVHYGPGDSPLCDNDCANAAYTDDPKKVRGCEDCLELVTQDLADENEYRPGRSAVEPGRPEPLPALREGRMVTTSKDYDDSRLNPDLLA